VNIPRTETTIHQYGTKNAMQSFVGNYINCMSHSYFTHIHNQHNRT